MRFRLEGGKISPEQVETLRRLLDTLFQRNFAVIYDTPDSVAFTDWSNAES